MSVIPLYSRGRTLKNVVSDWKKANNSNVIIVDEWGYNNTAPTVRELTEEEQALYNAFLNKYYFANIGFDSDDQFIFRANAIWRNNIDKYVSLLRTTRENGYSYEKESKSYNSIKGGNDTESSTGNREIVIEKTGSDVFKKGVTTTSEQTTSNIGDKLARATPNEKLSVAGESRTTVGDSGQDETEYGGVVTTTETPDLTKRQTYGATMNVTENNVHEKLTPVEMEMVYKLKSVLDSFAVCFEKLFMGVL